MRDGGRPRPPVPRPPRVRAPPGQADRAVRSGARDAEPVLRHPEQPRALRAPVLGPPPALRRAGVGLRATTGGVMRLLLEGVEWIHEDGFYYRGEWDHVRSSEVPAHVR